MLNFVNITTFQKINKTETILILKEMNKQAKTMWLREKVIFVSVYLHINSYLLMVVMFARNRKFSLSHRLTHIYNYIMFPTSLFT